MPVGSSIHNALIGAPPIYHSDMLRAAVFFSSMNGPTPENSKLRETCLECEYPLVGLPDSGRCPECGRLYDLTVISLIGSCPDRGQRRFLEFWGIIGSALTAILGVASMAKDGAAYPFVETARWIAAGGFLVCGVLAVALAINRKPAAVTRLQMGPAGYFHDDGRPPAGVMGLTLMFALGVSLIAFGVGMVSQSAISILGAVGIGAMGALALVATARKIGAGTILPGDDRSKIQKRGTRWKAPYDVILEPSSPDTYRLKIQMGIRDPNSDPLYAVDHEFACTSDRAEQIRKLIHIWRYKKKD